MRTKELKKYNLPLENRPNSVINAKPYELIIVVVVFGVILSFNNQVVFGGSFILLSLCLFMVLPNRILIEFYDQYMVLYNKIDRTECVMVYYEDVVYWNYKRGPVRDELSIKLVDESVENIEGFSKTTFERYLKTYMSNKKYKKQ